MIDTTLLVYGGEVFRAPASPEYLVYTIHFALLGPRSILPSLVLAYTDRRFLAAI